MNLFGTALVVVMACWAAFGLVLLIRRRPPGAATARRDTMARVGILVQGMGFACVWWVRRAPGSPIAATPLLAVAAAILAASIAAVSVGLALLAIRTLGREWSYEARLVEGHRLVTTGPYALIRHPIYTALFGMMIATGLVIGRPLALLAAIPLYAAGTWVRVRSEEALLRAAFGQDFVAYARRVPAVLPFPRQGSPLREPAAPFVPRRQDRS